MRKNWSHNHPAVAAWTYDKERAKRTRARKRRALASRIETTVGFLLLLGSLFVASWMAENDAPAWVSIPTFFSMIGLALVIFMENYRDDDLS
jgi:uncharacterized membrane protein